MTGALHSERPPMHPDKIAKLPKWAQDHVLAVEKERDEARAALEEVKGTDPRPPVAVRDPYGEVVPVAWDLYDEIRWAPRGVMDEDTREWVGVRRRQEGEIEISCSGTLAITPQSANVARVKVVRP